MLNEPPPVLAATDTHRAKVLATLLLADIRNFYIILSMICRLTESRSNTGAPWPPKPLPA